MKISEMIEKQGFKVEAKKSSGEIEPPTYIKPPTIKIEQSTVEKAIKAGILPEVYKNMQFDLERVKENQTAQINKVAKSSGQSKKISVKGFDEYVKITNGIISTIDINELPDQSYIIGAPNGFGKTSFVNTCILKLFQQERICTPFVSLTELAHIRYINERRIIRGVSSENFYGKEEYDPVLSTDYLEKLYNSFECKTYEKRPIYIVDRFSWSEYLNSAILFCYFTDVRAKVLESETLKTILTIRGTKGLPTIAMISSSLDPYTNDKTLYDYGWSEILQYSNNVSYDRVTHISCYKVVNSKIFDMAETRR